MPEAPLEALSRLEQRLEHLRTRAKTISPADVEDAVNVVRDLVRQLEDAGAPVYSEADLLRFIRRADDTAQLALKQAAMRLSEKVLQLRDDWDAEIRAYALARSSWGNWTRLREAQGTAFERLEEARKIARVIAQLQEDPRDPMRVAAREMARAFLEFTEPASIARWLREEQS